MFHISMKTGVCAALVCAFVGCQKLNRTTWDKTLRNNTAEVDQIVASIDHPTPEVYPEVHATAPADLRGLSHQTYRDITLDEMVQYAIANGEVMRDLGGTILRSPESVQTKYQRALQEMDPRFGIEAALSAFDAQLRSTAFFNNNDRVFNNPFFAGGTNAFLQDQHDYNLEVAKRAASGALLSFRTSALHDNNNAPGNTFRSAWDAWVEGEIRQPLLQGGGLEFNRIAGPNAGVGIYNGVLIAKTNTDINQTDFETGVRDYISNIVNAYWDLYFAYRDLDARTEAMNQSLETWQKWKANKDQERDDAATREALAREQYYRFKAEVDDSLAGRLTQGTQTRNGSTGGTLRGTGGVQVAERRLRLLTGFPISDGVLLRPAEEPEQAEVLFDWGTVQTEALASRPELRSQQLRVKRRQMELLASRNHLSPRLDAVARYRWRGFGDDLVSGGQTHAPEPDSAVANLFTGDHQEWQMGVELSVPLGFRQAHAAVAHAELNLSRERAIHKEQQRSVVHDASNAVAEVQRAYQNMLNNLNRHVAASEVLQSLQKQEENDRDVPIDRMLDAQRRVVEATIRYFRSRAEYAVALKNVHFEKGSLMAYCNIGIFGSAPINSEVLAAPAGMDLQVPAEMQIPMDYQVPVETPLAPAPEYFGGETAAATEESAAQVSLRQPEVVQAHSVGEDEIGSASLSRR